MCVTFVFGKHKTKKCRLTRISIDVSHAFSPAAGRILWWRTWTPSETYPHSNTSIKPNLTNRYYSKSAIKTTTRRMTHERGVRWPFGYYKPPGPIRSYGPHHTHTHVLCVLSKWKFGFSRRNVHENRLGRAQRYGCAVLTTTAMKTTTASNAAMYKVGRHMAELRRNPYIFNLIRR